ncbi:MAG TPA: WXG100 family type VII secretion target [Pseudonocardiaceae bacterium]|jgi:early secretory antigenic target protein ESAT-6|nr:WXG100 family type VII secretion target [Pseudonocardiaceae bacterium]
MTEGRIQVTFGELESARASIQTTWANISRELEDLKRYLQPMVETWSGEASLAYQAHQAKWDRAAADLNQVLNQIGVALGTSNENFQAAENANRNRYA